MTAWTATFFNSGTRNVSYSDTNTINGVNKRTCVSHKPHLKLPLHSSRSGRPRSLHGALLYAAGPVLREALRESTLRYSRRAVGHVGFNCHQRGRHHGGSPHLLLPPHHQELSQALQDEVLQGVFVSQSGEGFLGTIRGPNWNRQRR